MAAPLTARGQPGSTPQPARRDAAGGDGAAAEAGADGSGAASADEGVVSFADMAATLQGMLQGIPPLMANPASAAGGVGLAFDSDTTGLPARAQSPVTGVPGGPWTCGKCGQRS
jgi:hypothetical protein